MQQSRRHDPPAIFVPGPPASLLLDDSMFRRQLLLAQRAVEDLGFKVKVSTDRNSQRFLLLDIVRFICIYSDMETGHERWTS
jgi:hypothetical protein